MGESLFYSWLRHVKECQIVQTNWTTSSQWQLNNEDRLEEIMTQMYFFGLIIENPRQNHSAGDSFFCIVFARCRKIPKRKAF